MHKYASVVNDVRFTMVENTAMERMVACMGGKDIGGLGRQC